MSGHYFLLTLNEYKIHSTFLCEVDRMSWEIVPLVLIISMVLNKSLLFINIYPADRFLGKYNM